MHVTDQQRKTEATTCPECGSTFDQRKDGRPVTCSRSCARKREWRSRPPAKHRYVNKQGYVLVAAPEGFEGKTYQPAPRSKTSMVLEHRLVMAQRIGRPLGRHETVHHKNGDRADNRPDNLELRVGRHGPGATHAHCHTCTCFKL